MTSNTTVGGAARRPVRVVVADDECLFRASLRQLLAVPAPVLKDVYGVDVGPGFEVVGEADSGAETVQVVQAVHPDLLLLDLLMPRMNGLEALRELAAARDTLRTILLAGTIERTHLLMAVQLGVRGLVLKDSTTELLFEAIVCVVAGQCWLGQTLVTDLMESTRPLIQSAAPAIPGGAPLTRREREVITRVVAGYANKDIAREFAVSEETVKHHLTRIFDKVGAANRVELAMLAQAHGLVDTLEPPPETPIVRVATERASIQPALDGGARTA
jgi:two-component system nitrate/nitrite response regulator NarL